MPGPAVYLVLSQRKDILSEWSWAPRVRLLKMREVSAAGPCIKAKSHSQAEHLWPRLVAWHCSRLNPLGGRRPVGVPQHGIEGTGEVVGLGAAVVFFRGGQQAGQQQQQQQEQLQRQCCPDHP